MMTLQDKYQEEWSDKGVVYLKNKHNRGIYHISQRMGKIKVSILTIKKLFRKANPKILISYPDDPIKDSWITDFIKWGYTNQNITFVNTSSLNKYTKEKYDLYIIDEVNRLSDGQLQSCYDICNNSTYALGLSGTINADSKSLLATSLRMNVIVQYDTEQAIKDGILANYEISVHLTPLDNKLLSFKNSKGKMISEKTRFDNITWVIDNNLTGKAKMLKIFERTRLLNGSIAKFNKTKELLHTLEDKRLLLFTGLQKAAESYNIPYHHSGCKNTNLEDFKSNKIHKLALAEQGKIGVTYKNLDSIILTAFTGNDEMMSQVISRAILMDYGDKIADIHIICSTEEIELKKLKLALSMLDKNKIKYV